MCDCVCGGLVVLQSHHFTSISRSSTTCCLDNAAEALSLATLAFDHRQKHLLRLVLRQILQLLGVDGTATNVCKGNNISSKSMNYCHPPPVPITSDHLHCILVLHSRLNERNGHQDRCPAQAGDAVNCNARSHILVSIGHHGGPVGHTTPGGR